MVFHIFSCRNKYTCTFKNGLWVHGESYEVSHRHDSIIILARYSWEPIRHPVPKDERQAGKIGILAIIFRGSEHWTLISALRFSYVDRLSVCGDVFFPHPHKSNRSIRTPFSFARPLSWEYCPPPLISTAYSLRQHNLNSAGVQNSVIICLFKQFWVSIFFYCYAPAPFKSLRLSLFKCMLIYFVFFYNCSGILVGPSFLFNPSSFLSVFPSRISSKYSRSRAVVFFIYLCFFLKKTTFCFSSKYIAPFNVPFREPSFKGVWHVIAWRTNNTCFEHVSTRLGNFGRFGL